MKREIVIYCSRNKENYCSGIIKNLEIGNTKKVANLIKDYLHIDSFEINMVEPYSDDYSKCINEAREDKCNKHYPKYINDINLENYDVIYLGYPNYWGTCPMVMFSFLKNHDLTNKEIRPFVTHEGGFFGRSLDDIKEIAPNAIIKNGLELLGSKVDLLHNEIIDWINK